MRIDGTNIAVLQRVDLPLMASSDVEVEARGQGSAVVQVSYEYNLAVDGEEPAFFVSAVVDKTSTQNYLRLNVCTHYREGKESNMAVMEVELPSGYVADMESLPGAPDIKRVDTTKGDTNVVIYFDRITRSKIFLTVCGHRTHRVVNTKAVPIVVYDYYNRQQSALNGI
ncbi:unnamed protein product [Oppiella nova]|uniref:Alpha-macroglobulin receptor-binding domain-containing protein n=1 Tax=Oppiella nova TaxID=334625 RepID=A0A7R9M7H0_9ACAR|nr:unnamed protein product [Oppiella nova]CAG2172079.1 unnamed protein product [Oppiella nova]